MDETGEIAADKDAKDEFSVEVAQAWEQALAEAPTPATRKIPLRLSMIFSTGQGTVFRVLRQLVRRGLGGAMAGGRQYVSWIHEEDFCRAVEWILEHPDLRGPFNVAAPNPLPNAEMMAVFRRVCAVPVGLPAARWMLEIGAFVMRTETELMIKSRRVVPGKLLASGFQFHFPTFQSALEEIDGRL
jgi:NAD dependent epimerase/dehydratase family enzyme